MVKRTRVLIIPDVNSCTSDSTYYCMSDVTKCRYCDIDMREQKKELCNPCEELYVMKILYRDCGTYHRTTKAQRVQSMNDETINYVGLSTNDSII